MTEFYENSIKLYFDPILHFFCKTSSLKFLFLNFYCKCCKIFKECLTILENYVSKGEIFTKIKNSKTIAEQKQLLKDVSQNAQQKTCVGVTF